MRFKDLYFGETVSRKYFIVNNSAVPTDFDTRLLLGHKDKEDKKEEERKKRIAHGKTLLRGFTKE